MNLRKFLGGLIFAAFVALSASPVHAVTCNDPSGFLKTDGPITMGDLLVLGPDCQHAQDGGSFAGAQNVFNITASPFNAKCNYQLQATGNLNVGSNNLTSSSAIFTSSDVGKTVVIANTGTFIPAFQTTIIQVNSPTSVILAGPNPTGGILGPNTLFEYGNDDTAAIQAAVNAAVATPGSVYIPGGKTCWMSRLNLTNITTGFTIFGDGPNASRLMPVNDGSYGTAQGHAFDLTGSAQVTLRNFQFGAFNGLASPTTGLFLAQVASNASNRIRCYGIYFSGKYVVTTFYDYGVPSSDCLASDFYNYTLGSGAFDAMKMSSTNAATSVGILTSAFTTIANGTFSTSDFHFYDIEWHKFAGAGASGDVISLDNTANISIHGGVISGGASQYVTFSNAVSFTSFINVTFETESQPVIPTNAFFLNVNASLSGIDWNNSSFVLTGNAIVGGTGIFTDFKKGTFFAGNGGAALSAGNTYFFGAAVLDTVSPANAFSLLLSPSVISNIFCQSSASPGQAPGYTLNVEVNGSVTSIGCIISAGNTTCSGNGYVVAAANSNINFRSVNAAATNTTRMACSTQIQAF